MASFFSETAFNINDLDFYAPFHTTHTSSVVPGGSFPLTLPDLTVLGTTFSLPGHVISFDTAIRTTWGASNIEIVAGNNLTFDLDANVTGGTATFLASSSGGLLNYGATGFSMNIMDLVAAGNTASNSDDIALFRQIYAGNDLITLSALNDAFDAGSGDDLVVDQGGNDKIAGGDGNDVIMAAAGNDRVDGGNGADILIGAGGDDVLKGAQGQDFLWAGRGTDIETGGTGRDVFLFKSGDGKATITDFNAADDQLVFMGAASGIADLHFAQVGANTRVTFGDIVIILLNVDLNAVSAADVEAGGVKMLAAAAHGILDGWDYIG